MDCLHRPFWKGWDEEGAREGLRREEREGRKVEGVCEQSPTPSDMVPRTSQSSILVFVTVVVEPLALGLRASIALVERSAAAH